MKGIVADHHMCTDDDIVRMPPWLQPTGFRANSDPIEPIMRLTDGQFDYVVSPGHFVGLTERFADGVLIWAEGDTRVFRIVEPRGAGTSPGLHDGDIEAPMPGKVTAVEVSTGETVTRGQRLLTLEAMKMEHALTAPFDGTVVELNAAAGAQVTEGQVLVKVEPEQPSS
jgi:3-methylcrotonyl-CoA carboxylase alpha subunit